jgi:SagB-type dehydrogenase family enzyme
MIKWILPIFLPIFLALAADGFGLSRGGQQPEADSGSEPKVISLPRPDLKGISLEEAILARRSIRQYSAQPLSLAELSQLLFAAQGITGHHGSFALRASPSAGALYPIELYAVINKVHDLQPGLYHYLPRDHALLQIRSADLRSEISQSCLGQDFVGQAGVAFVMTAVYSRTTGRYGERGVRYVHMEAGHISQNIYLQATSLGLGSVAVGAFRDEDLDNLLDLSGKEETTIYVHAVGKIAE